MSNPMTDDNPLVPVSMQIIMHAGNASNNAREALSNARAGKAQEAQASIKKAHEDIDQAHLCQTQILQSVAAGEEFTPNLLFTHAQDILMTIQTEVNVFDELVGIIDELDAKIATVANGR